MFLLHPVSYAFDVFMWRWHEMLKYKDEMKVKIKLLHNVDYI